MGEQLLLQQTTSAEEPGSYRPHRDAKDASSGLVTVVVKIHQDGHLTIRLGQCSDSALYRVEHFLSLKRPRQPIRARCLVPARSCKRLERRIIDGLLTLLALLRAEEAVPADGEEPGPTLRACNEGVPALGRDEVGVLHQVLGRRDLARQRMRVTRYRLKVR